jgi:hypothetical protein
MTYEELLSLARSLEGRRLRTVTGKGFTVGIYRDVPFFTPESSGNGQSDGRKAAERFLERFNATGSMRPAEVSVSPEPKALALQHALLPLCDQYVHHMADPRQEMARFRPEGINPDLCGVVGQHLDQSSVRQWRSHQRPWHLCNPQTGDGRFDDRTTISDFVRGRDAQAVDRAVAATDAVSDRNVPAHPGDAPVAGQVVRRLRRAHSRDVVGRGDQRRALRRQYAGHQPGRVGRLAEADDEGPPVPQPGR